MYNYTSSSESDSLIFEIDLSLLIGTSCKSILSFDKFPSGELIGSDDATGLVTVEYELSSGTSRSDNFGNSACTLDTPL